MDVSNEARRIRRKTFLLSGEAQWLTKILYSTSQRARRTFKHAHAYYARYVNIYIYIYISRFEYLLTHCICNGYLKANCSELEARF